MANRLAPGHRGCPDRADAPAAGPSGREREDAV